MWDSARRAEVRGGNAVVPAGRDRLARHEDRPRPDGRRMSAVTAQAASPQAGRDANEQARLADSRFALQRHADQAALRERVECRIEQLEL